MTLVTYIREAAEEVLREAGIHKPPVPVEDLARRRGVQIRYEAFEGELSGLLFKEEDRAIIGVNASHPKTRQRFTIAHELGHLMLHGQNGVHVDRKFYIYPRDGRSSQAVDPKEIEANNFAAELLMPAAMLEDDLSEHPVGYEDEELTRRLANKYDVSLQAMAIRLTRLSLQE